MPEPATQPPADTTLGELRAAGYRSRTVKELLRANLPTGPRQRAGRAVRSARRRYGSMRLQVPRRR